MEGLRQAIECGDDGDAVEIANGRIIEIWDQGRRVAVVEGQEQKMLR